MVCGVQMDGCAATRTPVGGERRVPVWALVRAHNNTMEGEQTGAEAGRSAALAERIVVAGGY